MKLEYIVSEQDRAIAAMVNVDLKEKRIKLNSSETIILQQAQQICERADQMLRQHYRDDDLMTDYGLADHALSNILEGQIHA